MMMIYLDQIQIIVLPIRQVLQKKLFGQLFFYGCPLLQKGANIQKSQSLKKNPAYGRHQLSRPMRIEGPIQN